MSQTLGSLAAKSKIELGTFQGVKIVWVVAEKNHTGMPADSTLVVADKVLACLPFDAAEPSNSDSQRKSNGNNDYTVSNLRQWLNSKAAGGQWYSSQHSADQAPDKSHVNSGYNAYDTLAGFLNAWEEREVEALLDTDRQIGGRSGNGTTCKDKVFLLTTNEYGLETIANNGTKVALFTDNASRVAYPTPQCVSLSDYPGVPSGASSPWYYWTATSYPSNGCNVRFVYTDGSLNIYGDAFTGIYGVRPACSLSSQLLVSDTVNDSGNYTIIFNQPPTAPGTITVPERIVATKAFQVKWDAGSDPEGALTGYELERKTRDQDWGNVYTGSQRTYTDTVPRGTGTVKYRVRSKDSVGQTSPWTESAERAVTDNQPPAIDMGEPSSQTVTTAPPTLQYTITDPDGDEVTVREYIDGKLTRTHTPQLSQTQDFKVDASDWVHVLNGPHTYKVEAEDPEGEKVEAEKTWEKDVSTIDFTIVKPYVADADPQVAVLSYAGSIPPEATIKIEICNNGNDEEPAWVDATAAAEHGTKVFMQNKDKTAEEWGLGIRVHVDRGEATDPVYLVRVDGNFA